jgi:hypothetical protein
MSLEPHSLDTPGFIVAWRHKQEFKAGKMLDDVMTYGEALKKAEQLNQKGDDMFYWVETQPQKFAPH